MAHNEKYAKAIEAYRAKAAQDTRTREQVRADNRRARLQADAKERGSRQAATMASKAKRGI
jgi:hypothetical protein